MTVKKIFLASLLLILSFAAKSQTSITLPTKEARWLRDQAVLVPELKKDIRSLQGVVKDLQATRTTYQLNLQECAKRDSLHQSIVQSKTNEFQAKELGYLAETTALNKQVKKQKRRKNWWKVVATVAAIFGGYQSLK